MCMATCTYAHMHICTYAHGTTGPGWNGWVLRWTDSEMANGSSTSLGVLEYQGTGCLFVVMMDVCMRVDDDVDGVCMA
jgi:hypothetical protein